MERSTRFLVVDDFESMRKTIKESLLGMGYPNVEMASDGKKAIELLKQQDFDCVISDWTMPTISGIELLKFVRGDDACKGIRFMLITAMGERDQVEEAIAEGVDQFLVKPFTLATLSKKVNSMLERPVNTNRSLQNIDKLADSVEESSGSLASQRSARHSVAQILVVDDVSSNIDFLVGLLKDKYKMLAATSGEKALKICQSDQKPDLILLDIMMPEMDGYEVCERLKTDPETAHIPILFLTAKSETEDMTRGFHLGAVDYIVKPASAEVLRARVDTHIRLKLSNDEMVQQIDTLLENTRLREDVERITRHDLKNPLSTIITSVDTLLKNPWLSMEQKEIVGDIKDASFEMLNLINRSLDLYKMETGTYKLNAQPFNIAATLVRVTNDARNYARARGVLIILEGPEKCEALGEEILTYSMLANLIRNAVEATPPKASVKVSLAELGETLTVSIHNPTPVPDEIKATIFEKYVTSGKATGTGLGTYSAKLMATVQKGQISLSSDGQTGTSMTVTLPAAP